MSKRVDTNIYAPGFMGPGGPFSSNILNLIIFVLIVLQFGTRHHKGEECEERDDGEIDNSILFVIALFFLFVCSCGSGFGVSSCGRSYC